MSGPGRRLLWMIGNAHIDAVWLWRWPEGLHEVRATFASVLALMEEYPELVFTCDSVAYLAWVEGVDPEMFAAVRRRVDEGRWQLVGGWWVEPDCNIPSGESLVRQGLYGQRYLYERLATTATTGCNVDPFGHPASLPQILSKSGMDSYVFLRPEPHEKQLPAERFVWRSGARRVLAYRIPHGYTSPGGALETFVEHVLEKAQPDDRELMVFYGVGNHGGGPTRANLDSIRRLAATRPDLEPRCGSMRKYFDGLSRRAGELPEYEGELQHHAVGCYTSHSGVKRWNRQAESMLDRAERMATLAGALAGAPYPGARIEAAWKLVLFNQFHDTLAGTAIASAYDDSRDQYGHARSIAADVADLAGEHIDALMDIPDEPGTVPFVVWNPLAWEVRGEVEMELDGVVAEEVAVSDLDGVTLPSQRVQSEATVGERHRRLLVSLDLPALGYRVCRVTAAAQPAADRNRARRSAPAGDHVLDNGLVRAVLSKRSGWLTSLVPACTGRELLPDAPPCPHAVVVEDPSDTWGHAVSSYDVESGRFEPASVRVVEEGPVRSVVRVTSRYGASTLVEDISLAAGRSHLQVRVELDWRERHKLLKLRFPTALTAATATYSIPYGHIERECSGHEEPAQSWVDVAGLCGGGRPAGLSLVNDGKYGFDVRGGEIGLSAARSPVYAAHDPAKIDAAMDYRYLDQGWQRFSYGVLPHGGDWRAAGTVRLAAELNMPPAALPEHAHRGRLGGRASFAAVSGDSVIIAALKQAEDGDAVVVRAYETAGKTAEASFDLAFAGRSFETSFAPGEVRTFLVPVDTSRPIREVSLLEWDLDGTGAAVHERGT